MFELKHFRTNWTSFIQKKIHQKTLIYDCKLCDMSTKNCTFFKFFTELCVNVDSTQTYTAAQESRNENNCILFMLERQMSLIFQVRTSHISNGWNKFWPVHTYTIVSFQLKSTNKGMMLDCCWSLLRFLLLFSYRVLLLKIIL